MEESNKLYCQKEYEKWLKRLKRLKIMKSLNLQNLLIKPFTTLMLQIVIL